ncbi:MAG: A/G-specific adenine glycosylase [Cocleimonas sp.]|nr:A/G-specific adenine glycosylase [Cocleimonas sp.]
MIQFSDKLLAWFDQHGRKGLPWQYDINPYRVWVSEIMLQQTQVKTVIPYYEKFMASFPDVQTLANADQDMVLKHWSGLGYYARARNMHKAAQMICDNFAGVFPDNLEAMQSLSGIGRSTAAAILSIASNQQEAILDGNVKRVLSRVFAVKGWPGKSDVLKKFWLLAEQTTPKTRNADYTQAIMDLGATLCTRSNPRCDDCPLNDDCLAFQQANQTDYPTKKPKKSMPEKQTIMLIIKHKQHEVLMQKRPPVGIWGGLWCFPQFEKVEHAEEWLVENYNTTLDNADELPKMKHTFSHFHLHIQPLIVGVKTPINLNKQKMGVMEQDDSLWYNITTEFNGGLAAPVQTLLKQIRVETNI